MIHLKRKLIPLDKIRPIHGSDDWKIKQIKSSRKAKPPVLLLEWKNSRVYHLMDGHHRTAANRKKGKKAVLAWVIPKEALSCFVYAASKLKLRDIDPLDFDEYITVRWQGKDTFYTEVRK